VHVIKVPSSDSTTSQPVMYSTLHSDVASNFGGGGSREGGRGVTIDTKREIATKNSTSRINLLKSKETPP
jgi:hypothetical protein